MMTKDKLVDNVGFVLGEGHKELQLFCFVAGDDTPYRLAVSIELESVLINVFATGIKNLIVDKEYKIVDYSSADERNNRYYLYDLEKKPNRMEWMSNVIGNHNVDSFDFNHRSLTEINTLIALLSDGNGHTFTLYKVLSSVEKVVKSTKQILARFHIGSAVLEEEHDNLLKITPKFQDIYTEDNSTGNYIFLDSSVVEGQFNLHQILNNQANNSLAVLQGTNLLKDVAKFERHMNKLSFSRKLVGVIKTSKVIRDNISKERILCFIDKDDGLREEFKIVDINGDHFIDITNFKCAKRFLELLNDEFVYSTLTEQKYQAVAKDER